MPGFSLLFFLDRIHNLCYRTGERIDLHRSSFALRFALAGIDPVALLEVAHGDADFGLAEIGAPLDVPGRSFINVREIYKHFGDVSLDSDAHEELGEFFIAWRKIPYLI